MDKLLLHDYDLSLERKEDCLHAKVYGVDSAEVSLDICLSISQELAKTGLKKILFEDYLDMPASKHMDIMRFIQRVVLIRIPIDTNIAVVCKPEKYGTNQFIAHTLSRLTPYKARVFTSLTEAQMWLDCL